jgi:hypothetical protein
MNNLHSIVKIPQLNIAQLASIYVHVVQDGDQSNIYIMPNGEVSYTVPEYDNCTMDHEEDELPDFWDIPTEILKRVIFYYE